MAQEHKLNLIQLAPLLAVEALELRRCHTGDTLELAREIGYAGVVHLQSNLRQRQLVVGQQLLHPFDALFDVIALDGL